MSATRIQTVLLDADGVMQAPVRKLVPELEALCEHPRDAKNFTAEIFAAEKPCLIGEADFAAVLDDVLKRWRINTPLSGVLDLWRSVKAVPEVLDVVAGLRKRGIRVCLATNQQSYRADFMTNDLNYATFFDELFFSCQLGALKPDQRFFYLIQERLGVDPSEILFIDDQLKNVEAAQSLGMVAEVYHYDNGPKEFELLVNRYDLLTDR